METITAFKPFRVERNAWQADSDGGASYCGFEDEYQVGRYETLQEAVIAADRCQGNVKVYEMHQSPNGGEHGTSVYDNWLDAKRTPHLHSPTCTACEEGHHGCSVANLVMKCGCPCHGRSK